MGLDWGDWSLPDTGGGLDWETSSLTWEAPSFDFDYSSPSFNWDGFFTTGGLSNMSDAVTSNSGDWWNFDQSKISNSIQDVLSGVGAGLKTSVQAAVSAAPKAGGDILKNFINSATQKFMTTATGQQVEAAAVQQKITNFVTNPIVLFGVATLFLFLLVAYMKKG